MNERIDLNRWRSLERRTDCVHILCFAILTTIFMHELNGNI